MSINFNELRELLAAIGQTDITELTLKSKEFELTVRKEQIAPASQTAAIALPATSAPSALTPPPPVAPAPSPVDKKWVEITSPMVGTFYQAPAPDESPFVQVGDRITVGHVVCIIEAMKLMNEIEAEVAGVVMEIAVENGQPVEYGQTLMWIDPD